MKVAFFADVHSNIFALKAVLEEIKDADEKYCLGDVVGYLPFSNQTIGELKKQNISSLAGEWDQPDLSTPYFAAKKDVLSNNKLFREIFECTQKELQQQDKEYLMNCKSSGNISKEGYKIMMFHGMLDDEGSALEDSADVKLFNEVIEKEDADIYLFGHVHRPYVKNVNKRVFINCGSVGRSNKPGMAEYVSVDLNKHGIDVQIMQVDYDLGAMKKAFNGSSFPREIIDTWY